MPVSGRCLIYLLSLEIMNLSCKKCSVVSDCNSRSNDCNEGKEFRGDLIEDQWYGIGQPYAAAAYMGIRKPGADSRACVAGLGSRKIKLIFCF